MSFSSNRLSLSLFLSLSLSLSLWSLCHENLKRIPFRSFIHRIKKRKRKKIRERERERARKVVVVVGLFSFVEISFLNTQHRHGVCFCCWSRGLGVDDD